MTPTDQNPEAGGGAELLAAAQDLRRMLEAAYRQLGMWSKDNPRIVKADAAIAKALGGRND